ncbi:MAG: bacillithiol biosynthesis cysteine-adding enzyme BshC [Gemmatimonadota bacterium]|nr:MAG: bacillithiol biosynthesis cysteine-adding enzyme BshC [Gemmatimonadota bacterium]
MSVRIEPVPLTAPGLAGAYVDDYPRVGAFYLADAPNDLDSYREVAERIRAAYPASRWEALSHFVPALEGRPRERLGALIEGRGLFVATGQQAGLFVSPLYTLYKAFTAQRMSQQLEEHLEVPVMPLFSTASEDHDWAEVSHAHVIDLDNRLRRLSVQAPHAAEEGGPTPSVERILLGEDVEHALDSLAQATPDSEFKAGILEPLRDAYRPGRGLAEAFEAALGHLLRRYAFLLVRTAHLYVKRENRELLWSEWEQRAESEARLLERSQAISQAGFDPQVGVATGATNLFLEGKLGRDRVLYEGDTGRLRRSAEVLRGEDLRSILHSTPERLSPGALLRPVAEARAFPVVAHVVGPGEIAYLAQSQVLFALHEVPAPVVVPRAAFRMIEPKVARVLDKYGIRPDELAGDATRAINRLLDQRTPPELQESLARLRSDVAAALDRVEAAALGFDPGAQSLLGSGQRAIHSSIDGLESRLQARLREKGQIVRGQLEKAAVNLYPGGKPQERMLSPYPFLVRYGEGLLDEIYQKVVTPLD